MSLSLQPTALSVLLAVLVMAAGALGAALVGGARGNLCREAAVVGDVTTDAANGATEVSLGLCERQLGVGRIDHDQNVALPDRLRVGDAHFADRSADRG